MEVLAHSFIEDLYRVALLQVGDRSVALACVAEVVSEAESNASQWRTQKHRFLWAARLLSQRLSKKGLGADVDKVALPDAVQCIFEVLRAARPEMRTGLALVCTGSVKSGEVVQLLSLRSRDWRVALVLFRDQVAALGLSEEGMQERLNALQISPEECILLEQSVSVVKPKRKGWDKILAVAAVLLGVCVFVGWVAWEQWRDSPAMRMRRHMETFLDLNQNSGIAGLETFKGKAGETQDWLFLHGMEGAVMPEIFSKLSVVAARLLQWNGSPLALFPTLTPPGLLVVVESDALGLPEEGADTGRAAFAGWSGAWASAGTYKVLWMMQADAGAFEQQMQRLSGGEPPK